MAMNNILLGIGSWLKATRHLSDRAKGCYIDLLCEYYRTGGPLPYDEQRLAEAAGYKNVRSLRVTLPELVESGCFQLIETPEGPVLVNEKADREIAAYHAKRAGNTKGGQVSRPHSKAPRMVTVAELEQAVAAMAAMVNQASAANGGEMAAVSPPYGADISGKSEEKQEVKAASSSSLNIYTSSAHAHARGPVLVPPAPDPSVREAKAAKALARLRGQDVKPPAEGTPEYVEWELRQRLTKIRLEIEKICGDCLSPTAILHTGIIETWISEGADVEQHIYPAVRAMAAYAKDHGKTIGGINYFNRKVEELRDAAKAKPSSTGRAKSGFNAPKKPEVSLEMKAIMETLSLARQNGWADLHNQMAALLAPASNGDQQSLLNLKELHAKHWEMVRVPRSTWVARHPSAA